MVKYQLKAILISDVDTGPNFHTSASLILGILAWMLAGSQDILIQIWTNKS